MKKKSTVDFDKLLSLKQKARPSKTVRRSQTEVFVEKKEMHPFARKKSGASFEGPLELAHFGHYELGETAKENVRLLPMPLEEVEKKVSVSTKSRLEEAETMVVSVQDRLLAERAGFFGTSSSGSAGGVAVAPGKNLPKSKSSSSLAKSAESGSAPSSKASSKAKTAVSVVSSSAGTGAASGTTAGMRDSQQSFRSGGGSESGSRPYAVTK